jgi:hypothetical protein
VVADEVPTPKEEAVPEQITPQTVVDVPSETVEIAPPQEAAPASESEESEPNIQEEL